MLCMDNGMFHNYCCPPVLWDLLDHYELSQMNRANRSLSNETNKIMKKRRAEKAAELMNLFYVPSFCLFSTEKSLRRNLETEIRSLLRLLPELMHFLQHHEIHYLDLSTVYSHAKRSVIQVVPSSELTAIAEHIFNYVKHNPEIHYFNYSLFTPILTTQMVEDIVSHHPVLTLCAMRRRHAKPSTVLYGRAYPYTQNLSN